MQTQLNQAERFQVTQKNPQNKTKKPIHELITTKPQWQEVSNFWLEDLKISWGSMNWYILSIFAPSVSAFFIHCNSSIHPLYRGVNTMLMMFTLSFQWPFSAQRMTENEAPNICSSWTGSVSSVSYGKKNQWRSAATDAPKTKLSQLSLKLLSCKDKQYRQHNSVFSFGSIHWATQDNKNTIRVNIYIYIL